MNPIFDGHLDQNAERAVTGELRVLLCVLSKGNRVHLEPTLDSLLALQRPARCDVRLLVIEQSKFAKVGDLVASKEQNQRAFSAVDFALMPNLKPYADIHRGLGESNLQESDIILFIREGSLAPPQWLGLMIEHYRLTQPVALLGPVWLEPLQDTAPAIERHIYQRTERIQRLATERLIDPFACCLIDCHAVRALDTHEFLFERPHWRSQVQWYFDAPIYRRNGATELTLREHFRRSRQLAGRLTLSQAQTITQTMMYMAKAAGALIAMPIRPSWFATLFVEHLGTARGLWAGPSYTHNDTRGITPSTQRTG